MRFFLFLSVFFLLSVIAFGQTCTITGTSPLNWTNPGPNCVEGGNAGAYTILIIPAGFILIFNDDADTWTGTRIDVFGTLRSSAGDVTINASITVKSGGLLEITSGGEFSLGKSSPCPYVLRVATGGIADFGTGRFNICGKRISRGDGGGCNPYPTGPIPYCNPAGGYTGATAFDENGYNAALPIKLMYFSAIIQEELIALEWATTMEENFSRFIVQRSADGTSFDDIGEVPGKGFNIYDIESKYSFEDKAPLLGFNYYRIKAVDLDDSFEYFGMKAVKLNVPKKLAIYPNPSSGEVISFRTNFRPSESDRIILLNQLGVEIFNDRASNSHNNSISFQNTLRSGVYMLRYVSKDFEKTARVVVKN